MENNPRLEELFNLMLDEAPVMFTPRMKPYILELALRYATECSQASLEEAGEASLIKITTPNNGSKSIKEYKNDDGVVEVNKASITNPKNIIFK